MPVIDLNQLNELPEKKVIIADVDDTICESCQVIWPEMAAEIDRLVRNGFTFAFISGTKSDDLKKMVSVGLKETHHILGTTGTNYMLICGEDSDIVYNLSFTNEEKEEINLAFEKLINYYNIQSMTTKEDQLQDRDSQITLSAIGRHAPSDMKRNYDSDGKIRMMWVGYLRNFLSEDKYAVKVAGTTSIDVTRKGFDKESGIRKFAEHHSFDINSILFFGDKIYPGGNDFPATRIVDCISVKSPHDTLDILKKL
jgi:phosphomannomutase